VGCSAPYWDGWVLDENDDEGSGNLVLLEKEDGYIYISNLYEDEVRRLKILPQNLLKLLREWREKVCPSKPQYVKFVYDNDIVSLKVSDNSEFL
jgi:hypothetical protein